MVAALVPVHMAVGCGVPGFLPWGEATRARNVILISGDGMGPAHIEAARRGSSAGLELDRLELRGRMVTGPPDDPDETVTDSAAAATAWSTGSRTSNGSVGVDADADPLPTFGRAAEAAGRATGLVTTTSVTDASPVAFFASVPDRTLESRIARQYVDGGGPDVILGGGRDVWSSDDLLDRARAAGYRYADDAEGLAAAGDGKVLGLFADEEMWKSSRGRAPALATLTTAALERLSADPDGFFLFVEEERVDEASHANDGDAVLAAMRNLDAAVGVARAFAEDHPDTLLIVTGDHETGGLSVDGDAGLRWSTGDHTNVPTPVLAVGPGSDQLTGEWPNTRLHELLSAVIPA
jgi:alkaline phosphatase